MGRYIVKNNKSNNIITNIHFFYILDHMIHEIIFLIYLINHLNK